ncbi:hypothetical protein LSAJ156_30043 [Latilactobacillus sakei]|nr:hypothetical protein LSAJ156_30043 [Latilactobacillus sakei]SON67031.1 protein of unknown function [Latilactobacillus sakei]
MEEGLTIAYESAILLMLKKRRAVFLFYFELNVNDNMTMKER